MKVIVFRHGEAALNYSDDEARELTSRGRRQIQQAIEARHAEIASADLLLCSPYIRARQTGALIASCLTSHEHSLADWLQPASSVAEAIDSLYLECQDRNYDNVILVTHLPFVSNFIEAICGLARGALVMATGSVVCIETEVVARDCGKLVWQYHPN